MNMNLQHFATQTTTLDAKDNNLKQSVKEYYEKRLLDYAEPDLVHDQFGDNYPIPLHGGKSIEFRRFSPLSKALTPITEGVTPSGNKLNVESVTASIDQYGDYIELSDILDMTAIDPVVEQSTKILASQAGRTLDTITREVLCGGTQRLFAPYMDGETLVETEDRSEITKACKLSPDLIFKAAAQLKAMNAKPIDDCFVCIVHPYVAYDLMRNEEWIDAHKYTANVEKLYQGEIGRLGGVRFVETTEAKIVGPEPMLGIAGYTRTRLSAAVNAARDIYPTEVFTAAQASRINEEIQNGSVYSLYVGGVPVEVESVTGGEKGSCKISLKEPVTEKSGALVCGTGAGADGSAVFCCLVLGANAYARTELAGGGLQHIIKQRGSSGTADPLDQRSTVGWKATKGTERLAEEYMLRIECGSSYSDTAESN